MVTVFLQCCNAQVWAETADAHEAATAVSACSPSRRKARADLPAPPVDSERAFPRRRPPAARPSPAPCYASWALPGIARALARPIAVSSRAEGLDTDAARLPTPMVDSEGPLLDPLLEPKAATSDCCVFSRRTSTFARRETPFPKITRVHARNYGDFASSSPRSHILSEISSRSHSDLPESGVRKIPMSYYLTKVFEST